MNRGYIKITVTETNNISDDIDYDEWSDGFVAYSNSVHRLKEYKDKSSNVDGILTEVNLWYEDDNNHCEICAELENGQYTVQLWELKKSDVEQADGNYYECYYDKANTVSMNRDLFSDLKAIEVVVPDLHCNIFLSSTKQVN